MALLCSIFILVWFRFLCLCLCNIYCMIVIFILEIEGYWNNRLAQLPGGAPDTRVTYKVRWFLGSYHVVMSLQEALPLLGSHDVSRSVWTDAVILFLKVLLLWELLWGPDINQHGKVLQLESWLSIYSACLWASKHMSAWMICDSFILCYIMILTRYHHSQTRVLFLIIHVSIKANFVLLSC